LTPPFEFTRHGRNPRTGLSVAGLALALLVLRMIFDAALWILAVFALPLLPALWDLWSNPISGIRMDDDRLTWWSGRAQGTIPRTDLKSIRIDTSWDFSTRISAILDTGRRVRLPYECTPPRAAFEAYLETRGIPVERHHFSLR